jgi:hypothetical protein
LGEGKQEAGDRWVEVRFAAFRPGWPTWDARTESTRAGTTGKDEALLHEQVRLFIAAGPNPKRAGATRVVGVA